jgi:hypothetical protein
VRVSLAVNVIISPKLHLARRLKNAQTKLSSRQYFSKLKFLYFRRRAYVGLQHTVGKILRMRLRQPPLYAADRRAKTRQENHKHICFEGKLRIFPLVDVIIVLGIVSDVRFLTCTFLIRLTNWSGKNHVSNMSAALICMTCTLLHPLHCLNTPEPSMALPGP